VAKSNKLPVFIEKSPIGKLAGNIGMPKTAYMAPFSPLVSHP
jgi:hypothetical protein